MASVLVRVSAAGAAELAKRSKAEGRTVGAVVDRLLGTEASSGQPLPRKMLPKPTHVETTGPVGLCGKCDHPAGQHVHGGKCLAKACGCVKWVSK